MSQPLKSGENEIVVRLIINDRDYDDLEAYGKIIGKSVDQMMTELCPLKLMVEKTLETFRSTRRIAMEEASKGLRGEELALAIKRRHDALLKRR